MPADTPDTSSLVDELERLHATLTPPPWRQNPAFGGGCVTSKVRDICITEGHEDSVTDAKGIAAVRNNLPAILAALRASVERERELAAKDAEIERLRAALGVLFEALPQDSPAYLKALGMVVSIHGAEGRAGE